MNDSILLRRAIYKAFPGIPEIEATKLIECGAVNSYPANVSLCVEGNIEDMFYVILDGEVRVTKAINQDDDRLLKYLNPGDFFGEMGLIHNAPRAATVTTISDVSVLEINKESFQSVLQEISTVSLAMVREVSRRLRENDEMAIEDLRLKASELAEAYQKLAELEFARRDFLTTIAHELRTPLTSANGFLQAIQMGIVKGEDMKPALDTVSSNLQRIIGLTNDILFLQEMDLIFSDFKPISAYELIHQIVENETAYAEEKRVKVSIREDAGVPNILGDYDSLDRAFGAIINNAIKFCLGGGEVHVRIENDQEMVCVTVSDNGIGIPSENMAHIFTRFWRTEEYQGHLFGGVGLGLSIAKQVIEQHGGKIKSDSVVGVGSVFQVCLAVEPKM